MLDSTLLYDAVATMDTVTLIRSAIRGLLRVADVELCGRLRALLASGDDYASAAKPVIDGDDAAVRQALVDSAPGDGYALLAALDGCELPDAGGRRPRLLATVLGQDLETGPDGVFRIARRVAPDRVISTVDSAGAARAQDQPPRLRRLRGARRRGSGRGDHHRDRGYPGQYRRRRSAPRI